MSRAETEQTFLGAATLGPSNGQDERIVEVVRRLEQLGSVRELTALLS